MPYTSVSCPTGQRFRLAQTTGTRTATLNWHATNGRFAVVLTNADGSRGITATIRAATRLPNLAPLGWGLSGTGIALIVAAIVLIALGATGIGRRHSPPVGGPPPYPTAPPRAPVGVPTGTGRG